MDPTSRSWKVTARGRPSLPLAGSCAEVCVVSFAREHEDECSGREHKEAVKDEERILVVLLWKWKKNC